MGIFGQSSGFDADVEKATSETNTNENWSLIIDVCDKASNSRNAKDCLKAIMKRMGHNDPHVVMQAITLLDACVRNCGKTFHLEIASREFQNEFLRLLGKSQPKVAARMCAVLRNWAETDFKTDPELNLIPSLYEKLRQENYEFASTAAEPATKTIGKAPLKDQSANNKQEEADLAKAIELSLKDVKSSPNRSASTAKSTSSPYPSLYPVVSSSASPANASNQPEARKVLALYDFEAAEENELTFVAGDIIHVLDDSDPNWWKGYNQRGEGLFPSNFVTSNLSEQVESKNQFEQDSKILQHKTEMAAVEAASKQIEIDEHKIDRLLHLLNEANPEDPSQDTEEMLRLEQEVHQMGPLIDAELERVDRKHAQLSQLSSDLVDAINLYHSLMRDDRNAVVSPYASGAMPSVVPGTSYNGMTPQHHMMFGNNAAYNANYGPQSLPGAPTSMPYPGTFSPHLAMSMHMTGGPNQSPTQGMSVPANTQALATQSLGPQSHQMIQATSGQAQVNSNNIGMPGDPQHQQPAQPYQMIPVNQSQPFMAHTSAAGHTTQPEHSQDAQFLSPQHRPAQQTQPYINGTSAQLLSNSQTYNHTVTNGQMPFRPNHQGQSLPSNMPLASSHEQFGQMQQQMSNMALNNPSYPSGLQQNIPIFQQQR